MAAFHLAIDSGAEGLEFDVRLSRDRVPVVIHDESLLRTGGVRSLVSELTAKELARVDVGSSFRPGPGNENFAGERVVTLERLLAELGGYGGALFAELKCSPGDLEALTDAVAAALADSPLLPNVIVKSFRLAVVPRMRTLLPGLRTAALFAPKIMTMLKNKKHIVSVAQEFGAHELSVHYSLATGKLMEAAHNSGLPVSVWTVDNPRWVKRGASLGLRSIITNDPAMMLAARDKLT